MTRLLLIILLYAPVLSAYADKISRFNIYDRDFVNRVAVAESSVIVENAIHRYVIKYFDTANRLMYEQTVSYDPQTLAIVAGGFIDHRHHERASYVVANKRTTITTRVRKDEPITVARSSASYDYSETILLRVLHNLPILKEGKKLTLHMFVPSGNYTMAFEYFLDGTHPAIGSSPE